MLCFLWSSNILRTKMPRGFIGDFGTEGRLAPAGLKYVSSWVDKDFQKCFQFMETDDRKFTEEWIANWSDIVEFEVFPVHDLGRSRQENNIKTLKL